ncbi:CidA/LrgA family protein [Anaeromyxobacter oryzae]|uniref:LrgA family protein n=1 Tax=Anaeromyxobacter oryzae TaxID=2918170 RepID=A0ABM7WZJ7_9BACT|nr:CidA/LrgA family protein [Anaeromyxobacter oryzae]BDG04967.1 hypothetical protein AMOR_39630 [Anaeromyxobacter oryzae]
MTRVLRLALQVAALALFWGAGAGLSALLGLPIPGPVVGMALLLLALRVGLVRAEWFEAGTGWLFRHMLLFFVPAAVGAVQYPELLGAEGLRVLAVVAASTVLVMVSTGCVVDWAAHTHRGVDR